MIEPGASDGEELNLSSIGFGTAALAKRPGLRQAIAALDAAFKEGVTHFDAARMYGVGHAESLLGPWLRARRDEVTVATKVGLLPPPAILARFLPRRFLRGPIGVKRSFHVGVARASFERSLNELATDHVDLLLLHECTPAEVTDDLMEFLSGCVATGTARVVGVATDPASVAVVREKWTGPRAAVQIPWKSEGDPGALWDDAATVITHSSVSTVLDQMGGLARSRPDELQRWSVRLGVDLWDKAVCAGLALALAQMENPGGTTLFSSGDPDHVRRDLHWARAARSLRIDLFADLLNGSELTSRGREQCDR